jgi:hypothetical protein
MLGGIVMADGMADGGSSTPSLSSIRREDLIFLIAGALAFIFSFIDFAHITVSGVGAISGSSITAWHGASGVLAGLLLLFSVALGAVTVLAPGKLELPWPGRVIAEGFAALALLFFLIRWITLPSISAFGVTYSYVLAWGGYVTLVLVVIELVFGYLAIRAAGDSFSLQPSPPTTTVPPAGPPTASAGAWAAPASPPPPPPEAAPAPPETAAAPEAPQPPPPAEPPQPPPAPPAAGPPPEDVPPV